MIGFREVGVVSGDQVQAAAFAQHQIQGQKPAGPVATDGAAVIVDFNGMGRIDRLRVRFGQAGPLGMRDGDKGACLSGPLCKFRSGFLALDWQEVRGVGGGEVLGQSDGQNVPELTVLHRA